MSTKPIQLTAPTESAVRDTKTLTLFSERQRFFFS